MSKSCCIASSVSPGALSSFPEDRIVEAARIICGGEVDVPGRASSPDLGKAELPLQPHKRWADHSSEREQP